MSTKGLEQLKVELCRLIKEAAQQGTISGDEPLIIVTSLIAKMISEVSDERIRLGLINAVCSLLPETVEMYRENKDYSPAIEEVLH